MLSIIWSGCSVKVKFWNEIAWVGILVPTRSCGILVGALSNLPPLSSSVEWQTMTVPARESCCEVELKSLAQPIHRKVPNQR